MLEIVIVEDQDTDAKALITSFERFQKNTGETLSVYRYHNGLDFLESYRGQADMIFMDIDMPGMNGLEVSRDLRRSDENVTLIFVTNMAQLAIQGYEVFATDFVIKPVNDFRIHTLLSRQIQKNKARQAGDLVLKGKEGMVRLRAEDIFFVDVLDHWTTFHIPGQEIQSYISLAACEEKLGSGFVRCSNSHIVNLSRVQTFSNDTLTLSSGDRLPISRSRKKEVLQRLTEFFSGL